MNERRTVESVTEDLFDLAAEVVDLREQLSAKQKQQIVTIVIAAIFAILNVLGIDVPVVPTV